VASTTFNCTQRQLKFPHVIVQSILSIGISVNHSWPPLTALRAFESVGRLLSFRKAAAELHVSPAAISHQIKLLEDQLGIQLFRRLPRTIELTDAGRAFLPKLSEGFNCLAQAVRTVRAHQKTGKLTISVPPLFGAKWLMPRLHRFVKAHPEIDVRVSASMRQVDTGRQNPAYAVAAENERLDDADINIRFGSGDYSNYRVNKLLDISFTPLCSPHVMEGQRPLRKPADLRYHLLLHDDVHTISEGWSTWAQWLEVAGVKGIEPERGPHFSHPTMGLDAAIDGDGVVLGARELATFDIAAKRLVAPFDISIEAGSAYYVLSSESQADDPKVAAFRNWLLQEAEQSPVT
jgi:LysR family transcriptional regulator, glycine cleavage system transcriptional activator